MYLHDRFTLLPVLYGDFTVMGTPELWELEDMTTVRSSYECKATVIVRKCSPSSFVLVIEK